MTLTLTRAHRSSSAARVSFAASPSPSPPVPRRVAIAGAALAGGMLATAFPDRGWWVAAPTAIALLLLILRGRGVTAGTLLGAITGSVFWLTHLSWLTVYLGPVPWLALAASQTVLFAVSAGLVAVLLTRADRWPARRRLWLAPPLVASVWAGREWLSGSWPYGGFGWGRVAASQVDGVFADLLPWLGAGGTGFAVVWLAATLIELVRDQRRSIRDRAAAAAVAVVAVVAVPAWPVAVDGTMRVAAVQAGTDASLFAETRPGERLADYARLTRDVTGVDVVVWPENAVDLDPTVDSVAAALLTDTASRVDASLLAGAITARRDGIYNTSLLLEPGSGVTDWYDKARPVPFGEYVPDRAFWRALAPDLIDLISRDYQPGSRDNTFDLRGTRVGVAICFDVVDDRLFQQMIRDGADMMVVQSNNADFGRTDQAVQQLAITRMRALETGRAVLNVSTVGVTATIDSTGRVTRSLPDWESGVLTAKIPRSSTVTPAALFAPQLHAAIAALAVLGIAATTRKRT